MQSCTFNWPKDLLRIQGWIIWLTKPASDCDRLKKKKHGKCTVKMHVVKDQLKWKYQLIINRREKKLELKNLKNPKAFPGYSHTVDNVYRNV